MACGLEQFELGSIKCPKGTRIWEADFDRAVGFLSLAQGLRWENRVEVYTSKS